ncbi:hypothetical protein FOZ60_007385 [Perkinsus olseni]|uniref:J domain-containing protein n=2 Tax=Perkinsus olseni TaxID=32597 RepID=A0A7J6NLI1_PEROL|nr:hypothetical protein FOZ60_007385 [Perkinsus olseni]
MKKRTPGRKSLGQVVPGSAAATRRTSSSSKSNSGALRPPDSDCHSIASTSLMSSVEGSCADDAISQAAAVSEGQNDEGETLNFDPLVWIANYLKEHNSHHHQQHDHQPCGDNEPPATSSMAAMLPDVVDDTVASVDVIEGATGHVGKEPDKRSSGSLGVHTNECPVKHKWVDDAGGHEPAGHHEGPSSRRGGQCPVCAALLEPHATRARENNLKLLTTALDVPPDARTITLRYGCRYGHKFTQSQNVSAPYDKPLSCPDCRLAKAPPPLRCSGGIFRSKSGSRSGGTSSSRGPVDPLSGLTPRERQAAALKAARMEYQASLHKGVSLQHQTVETTAKVNQLVTRLKSQVPSTREQVVLGIVECPDELGLWPVLRSLLDLQPQPGQTEVDKDRLYRRAALLCHPDKCDHERAKEAFAKLSAEYAASNNAANNNPAAAKEILEDDEASAGRRIIIHVDVPSVMHRSSTCRDYTELMVNKWLASMAWGTVDSTTGQWILAASSTSIDPPTTVNPSDHAQAEAAEAGGGVGRPQSVVDGSSGDTTNSDTVLITYLDYLNTKYGQEVPEAEDGEDGEEGSERKKEDIINELLLEFTSKKTSPGARLRGEFEQIIKCLSLPPSVRKGFGLPSKVNIRQSDADSDNRGHTGVKSIFRHGLYSLLPSFINMIIDFAHARRDFAIVLRDAITSDYDDPSILVTEDVASVIEELQLLCEGKHPAYCGKYKTKKIAIDGSVDGMMDIRPQPTHTGAIIATTQDDDNQLTILTFPQRNKHQSVEAAEESSSSPANDEEQMNTSHIDDVPTEYRGFAEAYSGLVHELIPEGRIVSIIERPTDDDTTQPLREILINPADTNIQHVYIASGQCNAARVVDVLSNTSTTVGEKGMHLRVESYLATTHMDHFKLLVEEAIDKHTMQLRTEKEEQLKAPASSALEAHHESMRSLTPRSYLREAVLPVLAPAINEAARDRPDDPITSVAMYMLKHRQRYNKVIEVNNMSHSITEPSAAA